MIQQALLLLSVFGIAGCTSIGPGTVTRDRFEVLSTCCTCFLTHDIIALVMTPP